MALSVPIAPESARVAARATTWPAAVSVCSRDLAEMFVEGGAEHPGLVERRLLAILGRHQELPRSPIQSECELGTELGMPATLFT